MIIDLAATEYSDYKTSEDQEFETNSEMISAPCLQRNILKTKMSASLMCGAVSLMMLSCIITLVHATKFRIFSMLLSDLHNLQ